MDINLTEQEDRLVIAFIGNLDNMSAPEAEQTLQPVYKRKDCDFLIDCSQLNYISSKGLRLLITLYKHFRDCGHRVFIMNMNKNVKEVLHQSGFLTLYEEVTA